MTKSEKLAKEIYDELSGKYSMYFLTSDGEIGLDGNFYKEDLQEIIKLLEKIEVANLEADG